MNKQISIIVLVGIIALGVGFFGGKTYAAKYAMLKGGAGGTMMPGGRQFQGPGSSLPGGMMQGRGGFGAGSFGEILSKDVNGITIKLRDGGSQIVLLSANTIVSKSVSGSSDDLTIGGQVTVMGTKNQDGSVTAESVQIRPAMPVQK